MITLEDIDSKLSAALVDLQELVDHLEAPKGRNLAQGVRIAVAEAQEWVSELRQAGQHQHQWVNVSSPGDISKKEKCECGAERDSSASDPAEVAG